ncbi:Wzz/FepE/Etk N-terminal domain-containing protein [uncultured Enterovirga sp.]|uniref:Wzz/FepE/Etk N-terminal domain-containing protein n=1 Tax=uncultured Enterovirga sp. TaxID=2026352 RepID=UPI0035CBA91C
MPQAQSADPSLASFLRHVLRRWRTVALAAGLSAASAGAYLLLAAPRYTATALLLIDTKTAAGLRSAAPAIADANVESANIESQVELLRSEHVARKLVEREHLALDPAFAPGMVAKIIDGLKGVFSTSQERAASPEGQVAGTTRELRDRIAARRIGLTYAVELSATMPDPAQAARIANAYAETFIADQAARREATARSLSTMLEARTKELQAQTSEAERKVEELKFAGSLQGESSASLRVTLKNLESSAQTFRVLHDRFLERAADTWQQQFMSFPDAQLASAAYPPLLKSSPRMLVILTGALLVGVALGLLRIILQDPRVLGLRA